MTARGGGPTPTELRNMGPRGVPTYPLGIAERWHRNLPSRAKERNPDNKPPVCHTVTIVGSTCIIRTYYIWKLHIE